MNFYKVLIKMNLITVYFKKSSNRDFFADSKNGTKKRKTL